jgi:hypothetical protein
MSQDWTYRLEALFADSRPVLDVKFDLEKRTHRLLPRDPERADALVFRAYSKSYTTTGGTTFELRLEAAYEAHNLYALVLSAEGPGDPAKEKLWEENLRRTFDRVTSGLALTTARAPFSPERYRQLVESTIAREAELANLVVDEPAIRAVQEAILSGLSRGQLFFTANKEGGTHIRYIAPNFVLQDYGESDDREEFSSAEDFLARLRKFYDWESRRDWSPHAPPEIEVWRYIERQMRD